VDPPHDQARSLYVTEPRDVVYPFVINLLVLTLVAGLAEHLAKRLKLTGGYLLAATRRADDAESLAALGRIAAGLAHEIRNPLGSILGSVQLITTAPGVSEEARHLCAIVERETARLNDLVGDMMQLARPRPPMFVEVDLARTACEVVALAAQSGRGTDVIVRYEGPTFEVSAFADAGQVRQVMWNLVRNAVQASSPGAEVILRVKVEDSPPRHRAATDACFEVEDDGPGISQEAEARLFEAFFSTRSNGIGIGLAVVKRIVDEHQWRIAVETGKASGAVFRVSFPASHVGRARLTTGPAPLTG
jgi:two-component system sensor histidine kinase HydH